MASIIVDDIAKAILAVTHAFVAVMIPLFWPTEIGITVAAIVAYALVFY